MAGGRALYICLLAVAVRGEEDESGPRVMRRELRETQLHLMAHEDFKENEALETSSLSSLSFTPVDGVPWCNRHYPLGVDGKDDCQASQGTAPADEKVTDEEDCKHAAGELNLTYNPVLITDVPINPNPVPKDCFKDATSGEVRFNPTDSAVAATLTGQPICKSVIYTNGTSTTTFADLCPTGYKIIDTWKECLWAHDCSLGGMYCQEVGHTDGHYGANDRVPGCYRNHIGCLGFNSHGLTADSANPLAADWDVTNSTPICKLDTYTFHPDTPLTHR